MAEAGGQGRTNQRRRTRKELLQAAARLMRQGRTPTLEEAAEEAMVSRATAYRYFSGADALLVEAAVDMAAPGPDGLFDGDPPPDLAARVQRVDRVLDEMILANEPAIRAMLVHTLGRAPAPDGVPARQNRRLPLIEAALEPARSQMPADRLRRLARALAIVIGTEGVIVCKDVLQLTADEARAVKQWAIQVLVKAAMEG